MAANIAVTQGSSSITSFRSPLVSVSTNIHHLIICCTVGHQPFVLKTALQSLRRDFSMFFKGPLLNDSWFRFVSKWCRAEVVILFIFFRNDLCLVLFFKYFRTELIIVLILSMVASSKFLASFNSARAEFSSVSSVFWRVLRKSVWNVFGSRTSRTCMREFPESSVHSGDMSYSYTILRISVSGVSPEHFSESALSRVIASAGVH